MDQRRWREAGQGIWAVVEGIKAYTIAYVTAKKEQVKRTVMEERRGDRAYEMLTTRAQELWDDLGMTNVPQPSTHAEAAAQTDEKGALDETTGSQRKRMATMEREYELKLEAAKRLVEDLAKKVGRS